MLARTEQNVIRPILRPLCIVQKSVRASRITTCIVKVWARAWLKGQLRVAVGFREAFRGESFDTSNDCAARTRRSRNKAGGSGRAADSTSSRDYEADEKHHGGRFIGLRIADGAASAIAVIGRVATARTTGATFAAHIATG